MKNTVSIAAALIFGLTSVGCSTGTDSHIRYTQPMDVSINHYPRMGAKPPEYEPNSLIIGYEPAHREAVLAKIASLGGSVSQEYTIFSGAAVRFADIEEARHALRNAQGVSFVEYNAIIHVDDGVVAPMTQ